MKFNTYLVGSLPHSPCPIVVDWSGFTDESSATDENIGRMIKWIENYPRKTDIHVYLGKVHQRQLGRRLQGALQALGCKVTTRQLKSLAV